MNSTKVFDISSNSNGNIVKAKDELNGNRVYYKTGRAKVRGYNGRWGE